MQTDVQSIVDRCADAAVGLALQDSLASFAGAS
jgi:hypothetical protein